AGDSFDSAATAAAAEEQPIAPEPDEAPGAPGQPVGCATVVRSCQGTARSGRATLRGGDPERALRMIAHARRAAHGGDASCAGAGACDDELRYLHAEALNQAGRLDDAVAAYRALDRRNAPSAMRQNALYAAAQIERRQGHLPAAT